MKTTTLLTFTGLLTLTAACTTPTSSSASTTPSAAWSNPPEPVLYARDGSVVSGDPSARAAGAGPVHDVGAREGTRMYLLELYQSTVEEKEALQRETEGLQATITRAAETQATLERERDAAVTRAAALEKELAQAQSENGELAARLVTAQIRRLEAEKLLLEARIDALRRGETANAKTTPASAPATSRTEDTKPPAPHGGH